MCRSVRRIGIEGPIAAISLYVIMQIFMVTTRYIYVKEGMRSRRTDDRLTARLCVPPGLTVL